MDQNDTIAKRELRIEYVDIDSLTPDPKNARKHSKKQITRLAGVIGEFGFTNPVLVDEDGNVIAGHARLAAARLRGMKTVPVIRLTGLSPAQKTALAIADNKLGDMSSFDLDQLADTLRELEALDFSVELTGFETAEVDVLLEARPARPDSDDDVPSIPVGGEAVSRTGDLWLLGEHRLLCGDALDPASYEKLLGAERADLIFTDPPFNVPIAGHLSGLGKVRHREFAMASGEMSRATFTEFLAIALSLTAQYSRDGSIHYVCMDHRHLGELLEAGATAYTEYKNLCVWDKLSGGMGSLYRSQHELVLVFKNGTAPHVNNVELGKHGRYRTNVWSCPGLSSFGRGRDESLAAHPTVKPVALVADAIRDCSRRGDLVLDPFAGSGTTVIAAERTRRRAAVMEIDPLYVDTVVRRWEGRTGKAAVLAGVGLTFEEVAADRGGAGAADEAIEAAHG